MSKSETKTCQNCKAKFTIEPEDFAFYEKIDVPVPTFCPDCRMQRRFLFKNDLNLYKRKCDFSGKEIFSMYSPDAPIKVYDRDVWWSDKWEAMEYGKDYDFNKPFFEQFKKLLREVPQPSRSVINLVNSDYCMNANNLKNCYLVFSATNNENCSYSRRLENTKDSLNSYCLVKCELCYEGFQIANCYKTFFSSNCADCQEVYFCKDCINCSNCFGCANLRHKKYHIFNKPYSKEEYFSKLKEFGLGSYKNISEFEEKAKEFWLKFPVKFMCGRKNVNVVGDDIYNSKNIFNSYTISQGEDLKYCQFIDTSPGARDCYDYTSWGQNAEHVYETMGAGISVNTIKFCSYCFPDCRNLEYCVNCHSCSGCFACVGLRHKQYCILNKQYTKEEYKELVPKIKKHMNEMPYTDKKGRIYKYGEFFPIELSPFAYNETIANEYFPLTKEKALKQGYSWYDKPKNEYKPTIKANALPDSIKDVDNTILKEIIECENAKHQSCHSERSEESHGSTTRSFANAQDDGASVRPTRPNTCAGSGVFRIIPQELKFYKKMNLPLPRLCPDCRHRERIKQRNPLKLWERQCMKKGCNNTFQTTYAPERKEIVYCERCYLKEVG